MKPKVIIKPKDLSIILKDISIYESYKGNLLLSEGNYKSNTKNIIKSYY